MNSGKMPALPKGDFMRALLLVLILISNAGLCAGPSQALTSQSPQPPLDEAKQCKPGLLGFVILAGFAYATRSTNPLSVSLPCPESSQAVQQDKQKETKSSQKINYFTELSAAEVMREAKVLYINQRSSRFNKEKLERELLKRREFGEMGLEITRNEDLADLILDVTRKRFTTRFTCSFLEPTTERVVAGVTASSLGGEIEPHLADAIVKQFKEARKASAEETKPD